MSGSYPPEQPQAQAGWYPVDGGTQRYWDGYEWTNDIAPLSAGQKLQHGISENDRLYAMVMHLCGLVSSFLVPLIMWLIKKEESQFIDHHGREALNFQISMAIYAIVSFILILFVIGILLLPIVVLLYLVFAIVAAVKAYNGEHYRIPISIPFFGRV